MDQALVAGDFSTLENREREAWQLTHTNLVGSQTRGGADGIVVRKFDMRELFIPGVLQPGDDHYQRLGHRVVHTFHPTVDVWVVGSGGNCPNP